MPDVHWCVTVDYQQIVDSNIANQIHGFTIDYGKFILIYNIRNLEFQATHRRYSFKLNISDTLLGQIAWQFACVVFRQKSPE